MLELEKKEIDLKKSILKLSKECANKFDKMDYLQDKQYFSNYCSRKLRQCFHIEPRSNADEKASAKNILDAFDKMFYIGKEANTPTQMRSDDNEFDNACDESDFAECEHKETKHSTNMGNVDPGRNGEQNVDESPIPQFDGHISGSSDDEALIKKINLFSQL